MKNIDFFGVITYYLVLSWKTYFKQSVALLKREIEQKLKKLSNTRKIVLITGARQVGKSMLVKEICESDRKYITLDDLKLRSLAQNDPQLFLLSNPGKLIIDVCS